MEMIPDADYIREAEQCGIPTCEPVYCPVCGKDCETIYMDRDGDIFACDRCIKHQDDYDWFFDSNKKE